ncbi:RidA family protein [Gammaproteobacteria bacterium]|nr:RidA family protein [Gammaproteobacteria bacterium]
MGIEKKSFRSGPFQSIFANGVQVGDTLYLAGQVSMDENGGVVGAGNMEHQLRQIFSNINNLLAEFDADMSNVVDECIFVTDVGLILENLETFCAVRQEAYGEIPNVSQTLVQVAALVSPDLLVEIKCVAKL